MLPAKLFCACSALTLARVDKTESKWDTRALGRLPLVV
jgi:hypothetical protein